MDPVRIAIIGNSGSGKSTLARQLSEGRPVSVLDLDTVAWEPGQAAVLRDSAAAAAEVQAFCAAREHWIVEGCYASLVQAALGRSPLLLFLEPGLEACLANCRSRPWEPHKYASNDEQDARLGLLLDWVRDYYVRDGDLSLAGHQRLFDGYEEPRHKVTGQPTRGLLADLLKLAG
jgi:adenylate kinase family enzyme